MPRAGAIAWRAADSPAYRLSPRGPYAPTRRSFSAGAESGGRGGRMAAVFVRACGGKSHSWLTPTISRSKPRAKRISVADGSSETIRMTHATLAQFRCRLFVEKIFAADLVEGS